MVMNRKGPWERDVWVRGSPATVLILKFVTQDFTDPGLLKSPAEPHCFVFVVLPSQVFQVNGNGLTSG